jgi:hypothetical protein
MEGNGARSLGRINTSRIPGQFVDSFVESVAERIADRFAERIVARIVERIADRFEERNGGRFDKKFCPLRKSNESPECRARVSKMCAANAMRRQIHGDTRDGPPLKKHLAARLRCVHSPR